MLEKLDVHALNERELNAQEIFEEEQLRAKLGTTPSTHVRPETTIEVWLEDGEEYDYDDY